jgi:hypothetical protein
VRRSLDLAGHPQRGDLEETTTSTPRRPCRRRRRNQDIAVDVCAMTVAGSLVYGLGEDKNMRLTVLPRFDSAGAPERVAQVVETSVSRSGGVLVYLLCPGGFRTLAVRAAAASPPEVAPGQHA